MHRHFQPPQRANHLLKWKRRATSLLSAGHRSLLLQYKLRRPSKHALIGRPLAPHISGSPYEGWCSFEHCNGRFYIPFIPIILRLRTPSSSSMEASVLSWQLDSFFVWSVFGVQFPAFLSRDETGPRRHQRRGNSCLDGGLLELCRGQRTSL